MTTFGPYDTVTMVAGEDLTQFTFVKMNTTDRTVVTAGNGEAAMGVVVSGAADGGSALAAKSGAAATVATRGRVMVEVGTGGLTAGDNVGVDANGEAVTAASADIIVGQCVTGAAAGGRATIDFFRGGNAEA